MAFALQTVVLGVSLNVLYCRLKAVGGGLKVFLKVPKDVMRVYGTRRSLMMCTEMITLQQMLSQGCNSFLD